MTPIDPWQTARPRGTASASPRPSGSRDRSPGVASRRLAAHALDAVRRGVALPEALARHTVAALGPADRAFARRLAQQVLLQRNRLDARLAPALQRKPKPSWVRELLLLGLVQLEMPDVADHAAVSATVEAAPPPLRALLNAILRRAARGDLPVPDHRGVQAQALAAGLPEWLLVQLRADWGDGRDGVLAGSNQPPPLGLRVNLQRTTRADYQRRLDAGGWASEPVGEAGLVLPQMIDLGQLPGFAEGEVSVQNASAQLAAAALPLAPGLRVLDACAAPGGKTAHLLEMEPALDLLAVDADAQRLSDVEAGLARLGLGARCEARALESLVDERFDRILLDVPCSATGIMRRHPDIRWLRRAGDIGRLAAAQAALLAHAWRLLEPGGLLLYASCSILLAETEQVVAAFVDATPGATVQPLNLPVGEALACGWRIPPGGAWDGFYYALLQREGSAPV